MRPQGMALTLFAWVHARTALLSTLRSLPTAPGSLGSSFAALIRVVILVVPLIFTLFSFAHELQSASLSHPDRPRRTYRWRPGQPPKRVDLERANLGLGWPQGNPFRSRCEWIRSFLTLRALHHTHLPLTALHRDVRMT